MILFSVKKSCTARDATEPSVKELSDPFHRQSPMLPRARLEHLTDSTPAVGTQQAIVCIKKYAQTLALQGL